MVENTRLPILAPSNRTLSEHIAEQLRQAILGHQLKPGQRIVEGQIAKAMETSRGPVRDALLLLENEGIVVHYTHRGTFVAQVSREDIEEIYSLRQAIESVALDYLIKNATPEQIDELDAHVQKMALMALQPYDLRDATELDLEFHRTLCRLSGHRRALDAWEGLSAQTRVLLLDHRTRNPGDFETRGVEWHRRLVKALRQRNAVLAQEELRKHLAAALESLLDSAWKDEA